MARGSNGLATVRLETSAQGAFAVFVAGVGGQCNRRVERPAGLDAAHSFDERIAVFARHADVGEDDIGKPAGNQLEPIPRRLRRQVITICPLRCNSTPA